VRLMAAPVDEETANLRRMKAKRETRGHNPSKALLELMDWTIFITTIPHARARVLFKPSHGHRWIPAQKFLKWNLCSRNF